MAKLTCGFKHAFAVNRLPQSIDNTTKVRIVHHNILAFLRYINTAIGTKTFHRTKRHQQNFTIFIAHNLGRVAVTFKVFHITLGTHHRIFHTCARQG